MARGLTRLKERSRRQRQGDFLHVLCGGGEQTLAGHRNEPAEARVTVTVQLLGIGKGALDGFLASLVDALAPRGQPIGVSALAGGFAFCTL
jgi:hypothetical protein